MLARRVTLNYARFDEWRMIQTMRRDVSHYMRSKLLIPPYSPSTKSPTIDANATNCLSHSILESNGFISDSSSSGAGLVSTLPLGSRVLNKLIALVRHEMNAVGGQEIEMPALCELGLWAKTGRDKTMGAELFRLTDRKDKLMCLCPTHEEVVTSLVARHAKTMGVEFIEGENSLRLYQITRKFRDEPKSKHGLFRSREFLMKDMYSFHVNEQSLEKTYAEVCKAYETIFKRLELDVKKAVASVGAMGGSKSHEYHLLCEVGEDKIVVCEKCGQSASVDLFDNNGGDKTLISQQALCQVIKCARSSTSSGDHSTAPVVERRAVECGHTFVLGDRYTQKIPIQISKFNRVIMGCYGIGVSRLMQACVEAHAKEMKFPEWPIEIAPFQVCVIPAKSGSKESEKSNKLVPYIGQLLGGTNNTAPFPDDVLVDDRTSLTIGSRLIDARLMGVPFVIVLGKTIHDEQVEIVINNGRVAKALDKSKMYCHSRELAVVLRQLKNDYVYKLGESRLNDYFKQLDDSKN